jgi:hypothetical protein
MPPDALVAMVFPVIIPRNSLTELLGGYNM